METDRCRLILEVATEGFWDWDLKTDRVYLSPRYCELIGYAPDEEVFDSAFLKKIVHPEDRQRVFEIIGEYLEGKRATSVVEHRVITRDGSLRWMEVRAKIAEYDQGGKPSRLVGTLYDVTGQRQTEEALQQSHTLLRNLSQQVPGALFQVRISPDGHICTPYASEKLNEIYEVSPEQILESNQPIFDRFHPEDHDRIHDSISKATEKVARWECEYRVVLPQQGLKWLYGVALPQRLDDGTVVFYGIIMDITERKQIEQTLFHSQQLLSGIIDNAPFAIFVKDARDDFKVVLWNKSAERYTGVPAATILGKNAHHLWPQQEADSFLAEDLAVVASRAPLEVPEVVGRHPDRGTVYFHIRKIPLFDNSGNVSHIVVISEDITEHRLMQAELLKSQKLESLGILAGGIAHDFNNILTGIVGNISYANVMLEPGHKVSEILLEAQKACHRASDLAQQLLTFAKGGQPIKRTVSAAKLVQAIASFVLRGSNVSSDIRLPDDLLAIEVDEGQISQVFNNIIINASQAMPDGGTVVITAENALVDAATMNLAPGKYVRVTFTDTGCGIPQEELKRVFDPYFTTKSRGSGLGLASAHSIVNRHGGHIDVRSTLGEGTTFEILLPASSNQIDETQDEAVPFRMSCSNGRSVLVMDDEEVIRDLTTMLLTDLGYGVSTCADGEEAIAQYRQAAETGQPFAAVIMDLTVPGGMGGKEASRRILELDPNACLIVSSGYSNDPIMARHQEFGFRETLLKPYTVEQVSDLLARVLQ